MRYPDVELDLLRAFVAVAESGSFTAAADVVARTQSAVSQKVQRLEEILDRRVFERTSRSLRLTREGEQLLIAARRMLEFNDALLRQMREAPRVSTLRLGVSDALVLRELPILLANFKRLHSGVSVELLTGSSRDLIAAYDKGRLDAVISKKDGRMQRGRVIGREPLVWIAAASYQTDHSRPAPLVMLPPPCAYRDTMIMALDGVRREWVAACTANSLMGVRAAVAAGLGVTVLGRSFIEPGMKMLEVPAHWPALPQTEITVIGEDREARALLQPLVTFLTESLAADRPRVMAA